MPNLDELATLRLALIREASRLHGVDGDPGLIWAGNTLSRLLEPRSLEGGLQDWVVQAALDILWEASVRVGGDARVLRRAKVLLAA